MRTQPTLYEILEVPPDATAPQLERAYRIARSTYQPASTATYSIFSDDENAAILRRIEEAYAVLSDDRLRRDYDAQLRADPAAAPEGPKPAPASAPAPRLDISFEEPVESVEPEDGVYDGAALRLLRVSRGVEIEEISATTKISETYLRFIEADRYADLPAAVYVRGFVREIARSLRLDPRRVVESYMARYHSAMGGKP